MLDGLERGGDEVRIGIGVGKEGGKEGDVGVPDLRGGDVEDLTHNRVDLGCEVHGH